MDIRRLCRLGAMAFLIALTPSETCRHDMTLGTLDADIPYSQPLLAGGMAQQLQH